MDPTHIAFDRFVQDLLTLRFARDDDAQEQRLNMLDQYPELEDGLTNDVDLSELLEAFVEHHDVDTSLLEAYDLEVHRITDGFAVSPYRELDRLVGLQRVKETITNIGHLASLHVLRKKAGLISYLPGIHMVFRGNPGTGKTTVGRILGRILKEQGFLSRGHLVECSRTELVAGYMGQTAEKTRALLRQAKGGILFVDEAYLLTYMGQAHDYGYEALGTIVKYMEDHRNDIVVVFAGYTQEMNRFLNANPGLRSRVSFHLTFPDYDGAQLAAIAEKIAQEQQWEFTPKARRVLADKLEQLNERVGGNGRLARTIVERSIMQRARRLLSGDDSQPSKRDMTVLDERDLCFPDPVELGEAIRVAPREKNMVPSRFDGRPAFR